MAANWKKIKSKVVDKDLDEEFEKFLNESLSDESLSSPRRSVTPHGIRSKSNILAAQSKSSFDKPWWATSEDEENPSMADVAKKMWLKRKEDETHPEAEIDSTDSPIKSIGHPLAISKDSLEFTGSRPGTALDTILSEPEYSSYDDSAKEKIKKSHSKYSGSSTEDNSEKILSTTDDKFRSTKDTFEQAADFETLEENKVEKQVEENTDNTVHFAKLNEELHNNNTRSTWNESAAAIDVVGLQPYRPPYYDDDDDESSKSTSPRHYSSEHKDNEYSSQHEQDSDSEKDQIKDDAGNTDTIDATDDTTVKSNKKSNTDDKPSSQSKIDNTEQNERQPTSLLSKVALMESLDSTGGLKLAERLSKLNELTKKDYRKEGEINIVNAESDLNLATGQTTADLAEALQQAMLTNPSTSKENVEIIQESVQPIASGMLVLDKQQSGSIKLNNFDLQPVISNFAEEPKIAAASSTIIQGSNSSMHTEFIESQPVLNKLQFFKSTENEECNHLSDRNGEEFHGFALQPIRTIVDESDGDSPPTESLKSITRIAEERKKSLLQKTKAAQKDIVRIAPKSKKKKTTKLKESSKGTNIPALRKNTTKPKASTLKQVTTESLLKHTKKTTPIPQKHKTFKSPTKVTALQNVKQDPVELIASVESFAYLKDFSNKNTSKQFHEHYVPLSQDAHLASLEREQSLQKELQQLRILLEEERKKTEKLHMKIISSEKEWQNAKECICLNYDTRIKDFQEEIFVLQKKIEIQNDENKSMNDIKEKSVHELSKEDIEKLRHQLEQQESLLTGYQQENERLYSQIKSRDIEKKKFEGKMFKENQKLASEVGNLREQLESRINIDSMNGPASLGAARITQLDNQIKFYQKRETENKEEIIILENEIISLKKMLQLYEKQKNVNSAGTGLSKQLESLKANHQLELDKLNKRLKWYAENQELLDKDLIELKDKRSEIKELRKLITRLEEQIRKLKQEKSENKNEKNTDAKRMLDLQRQVKEMEEIIRRRHPNSIPAMIYAASAVPGHERAYESSDNETSRPMNVYLEKQIKNLEHELETKDLDNAKKVRAIEQRYNAMSMRYEEHIKNLEIKIADVTVKLKSENSVDALQLELNKTKLDYSDIIGKLKAELKDKQEQISILKLQLLEDSNHKEERRCSVKSNLDVNKDIAKLKEKIKNKDIEIDDLHRTVLALQKEREYFLTQKSNKSHLTEPKQQRLTDRTTSSMISDTALNEKYTILEKENKRLRGNIEETRLECEEKRLKYEAFEAKTVNENRILRENMEDEKNKLETNYKQIIEKLKMDFVVEHSNSKVAELNGKLQSYELLVEHYKGSVEEARLDREKLESAKVKEESLRSEIRQLQDDLHEARKHHTPEMHHYKNLEAKIYSMETRHVTRENELQKLVEKTKSKASTDIDIIEDKWRDILRNKDIEVQMFREELDSIIEVLEELQRQGVTLPNHRKNYQQ